MEFFVLIGLPATAAFAVILLGLYVAALRRCRPYLPPEPGRYPR